MNRELKYLYRPKWTTMLFVVLFFGVCTAVLFLKARANDRGLIINGLIELSPENATLFYYVLSGVAILFVLMGIMGIYSATADEKYLVIKGNELVIPPVGFVRKEFRMQLDKPYSYQEIDVRRQRILKIKSEGRSATIVRSLMENDTQFEEVRKIVMSHVQ